MSEMTQLGERTRPRGQDDAQADAVDAVGWMTFAVTLLALAGVLNVVYGIAAIGESDAFTADAAFVLGNLETWGWLLLLVGAVQVATAVGVWRGSDVARWVGVVLVTGSAVLQLLWLPAYPFGSAALFALDMVLLFALIAFAGHAARR